jgi:hypothetical protein
VSPTKPVDLAQVARSTGAAVVEVAGWRDRGHAGGMGAVATIVVHHTAGPAGDDMPSLDVLVRGRAGLAGPLAHYGIGRSGKIYVVAAGLCWHAGQVRDASFANASAIGIEAENVGDGVDPWPSAQRTSTVRLSAALCRAYGLTPGRVLGHREVCAPVGRKVDPRGLDLSMLRSDVKAVLAEPSAPTARPVLRRLLVLDLDDMMHGKDVEAVQGRLGVKVDGWYGPLTVSVVRDWQRRHRLDPDGIVGPATARGLGLTWWG